MTEIRLAPELSATSKIVLSPTMIAVPERAMAPPVPSLSLPDDLHDPPPLVPAQGTRLHDLDAVAQAAPLRLVVGLHLGPSAHPLVVHGMPEKPLDRDDHGLLHPVAHDGSHEDLPVPSIVHPISPPR